MNESGLIFEHPVLWSEKRRRIEEKCIAVECLKQARSRRERLRRNSLIEEIKVRPIHTILPLPVRRNPII